MEPDHIGDGMVMKGVFAGIFGKLWNKTDFPIFYCLLQFVFQHQIAQQSLEITGTNGVRPALSPVQPESESPLARNFPKCHLKASATTARKALPP